jgi:hypothetical protein
MDLVTAEQLLEVHPAAEHHPRRNEEVLPGRACPRRGGRRSRRTDPSGDKISDTRRSASQGITPAWQATIRTRPLDVLGLIVVTRK